SSDLIEAHDGSTRWQREDVLAAEILGPTSSGQFAVLDRTRPAADLEVRSSLDGEPVAATTVSSRLRRLPANNPADRLDAVLVGAQRALVLEVELDDPAGASTTLRAFDLAPPGTTVSAASAALAGSWYRPDTAGQGLYLDWLPDQHTVFGAWFTSSVEGGHAHSEQRWY